MDTRWLNEWAYFVEGKENSAPPGLIFTDELLDEDGAPLKSLEAKVDYRYFHQFIYAVYCEIKCDTFCFSSLLLLTPTTHSEECPPLFTFYSKNYMGLKKMLGRSVDTRSIFMQSLYLMLTT